MYKDNVLYLGIRHHGPGSAASARRALATFAPDKILLEGAPEATPLIAQVGHPQLVPPVAQLIYTPDDHRDSVFYPFTAFSPEWQTLLLARERSIPVEFFDLPQCHSLALQRQWRAEADPTPGDRENENPDSLDSNDSLDFNVDPLDLLARAAGYDDGERWWERVVEQHPQEVELFAAIADAMGAVRDSIEQDKPPSKREQLREAWMRKRIRQAKKDGFNKIAVVCGAWHVPALTRTVAVKDDNTLLKNLPKVKLKVTWIPWTYSRISYRSGYGAGVESPGWYDYLWRQQTQPASISAGWMTRSARIMRAAGLDVAPASIIDAVRLAENLAALRERSAPGLDEITEAMQTLFSGGEPAPLALLKEKLLIGEHLGQVPDDMPMAPLQEDFQRQLKSLRLKPEALEKQIDLDLRKEIGLGRSVLFHRLVVLEVPWGKPVQGNRGKGTFKESWVVQWHPECELNLIEKSIWGNSVKTAAQAFAVAEITQCGKLGELIDWLHRLLRADLPAAIDTAMRHTQRRAALETHVSELMEALPGLVNIVRYGDVRGTDTQTLNHLIESFCSRINAGLVNQCRQLDEETGRSMAAAIAGVDGALRLLDEPVYQQPWQALLLRLTDLNGLQGVIAGKCLRLLENAQVVASQQVADALSLALSRSEDPMQAAAWIEGLLADSGLTLLHDDLLWEVLDSFICRQSDERFQVLTPLLRRTFSTFAFGERRGLLAKSDSGPSVRSEVNDDVDHEKAAAVLPLLDLILDCGNNGDFK